MNILGQIFTSYRMTDRRPKKYTQRPLAGGEKDTVSVQSIDILAIQPAQSGIT